MIIADLEGETSEKYNDYKDLSLDKNGELLSVRIAGNWDRLGFGRVLFEISFSNLAQVLSIKFIVVKIIEEHLHDLGN
jgi:hypothetical protein